jgi:uncharacterized protein DUF4440
MITDQIRDVIVGKANALIRKDADHLAALLHPDFLYVNARGMSFDKGSFIESFCLSTDLRFERQDVAELQVRTFPGFAAAAMILHETFFFEAKTTSASYRSFCIFPNIAGRWCWAGGQTMQVPLP